MLIITLITNKNIISVIIRLMLLYSYTLMIQNNVMEKSVESHMIKVSSQIVTLFLLRKGLNKKTFISLLRKGLKNKLLYTLQ
jgi:hypothetical protein